ncbi:MAG: oligosaccharide flippase family protein [Nanoarchaeota archaeon]
MDLFHHLNRNHGLLKHTLVLSVTSVIGLLFNYLFYAFIGRSLSPEDYSVFASLQSFFFIFFVLGTIMNVVLIQFISYFESRQQQGKTRQLFQYILRASILIGIAIILVFAFASHWIAQALDLPTSSVLPIFFLGLQIATYLLLSGIYGMMMALQRFLHLGINRILVSVFVLLVGIAFLGLGLSVTGIMLAFVLGNLVGTPSGMRFLKPVFAVKHMPIGAVNIRKAVWMGVLFSLSIGVLANIDVILAKLFLPITQAGYYAAAAFMGKVVFFISMSLAVVMFPKVAGLMNEGKPSTHLLKETLKYMAIISLPLILIAFLFPYEMGRILFGAEFAIAPFMGLSLLAFSLLAFSSIVLLYLLAIGIHSAWKRLLGAIVLEALLISLFHGSEAMILLDVVAANVVLLFALVHKNWPIFVQTFKRD